MTDREKNYITNSMAYRPCKATLELLLEYVDCMVKDGYADGWRECLEEYAPGG